MDPPFMISYPRPYGHSVTIITMNGLSGLSDLEGTLPGVASSRKGEIARHTDTMVEIHPLTPDRWDDLTTLFGRRGAYGGCWCMYFRITGREFDAGAGEVNRARLRSLVDSGRPTGLLAYGDDGPVGWVALAPRAGLGRLRRSPLRLGDPADPSVWSLPCLYVSRRERGNGLTHELVAAACEHARRQGASIVEAMPLRERGRRDAAELYVGTRKLFEAHGFTVAAEPKAAPSRLVMRREFTR
jgi:GNAT superfamily N-acetyltransferase